jgi:hypothetical protein
MDNFGRFVAQALTTMAAATEAPATEAPATEAPATEATESRRIISISHFSQISNRQRHTA